MKRSSLAVLALAAALLASVVLAAVAQAGYEDFAIESSSASVSNEQAGAHADFETRFYATKDITENGGAEHFPWAAMRDLETQLPPGLLGNPSAYPTCEAAIFAPNLNEPTEFCPPDTQVGMIEPGVSGFFAPGGGYKTPLINLEPPAGDPHVVARLGFVAIFFPMVIDLRFDAKRDNALTATVVNAPSVAAVTGSINRFWGVPTDEVHDHERFNWFEALFCAGPCSSEPTPSGLPPTPFMSNPTSCGPAEVGTGLRGYEIPEGFDYAFDHFADFEGCDAVPFDPTVSLAPTTNGAGASGGIDFSLQIPQIGMTDPDGRASAHLRKSVVTLPEGVSLNASAAEGLGSCTEDQIGVDRDERQIVDLAGRTAPVALEFEGQTTAMLPQIATAAQVQAALEALPNVSPGDVAVSGRRGGPWTVDFGGAFGSRDVPTIGGFHSELQMLSVAAQGGTYKLVYEGAETASLDFDAEAPEIQAALEALPTVAPGDLVVTGGPTFGNAFGTPPWNHRSFHVAFGGPLSGTDVPAITTIDSLEGSNPFGGEHMATITVQKDGGAQVATHVVQEGGTLRFDEDPPACPESSKIAVGEITTPVLRNPIKTNLYVAKQADNPFRSLFAGYLVAQGQGVLLKIPAKFDLDPRTGQIVTTFDDNPQQPFSELDLHFKGGNRGLITTPTKCGTYASKYELTPWSGTPPVTGTSAFTINQNCGDKPFSPEFRAGSTRPVAGAFTSFATQITRAAGTPAVTGVKLDLPPGLTAELAGVPSCPDAALARIQTGAGTAAGQSAAPSCPAASQVGTVAVGAGSGSPFYVRAGHVYLAGPYKGAPLSLAVVVPALAGPFDLGNVVVRVAVRIDPVTTQVHAASDSLPTMLQGVPLDIRDLRVQLDRPAFMLNPTSCAPRSVDGTIEGAGGAVVKASTRFQVGECAALGLKPKISLQLKGGTARADHPALKVVLRPRPGDANLSSLSVAFPPRAILLDQAHIGTVCTRVQFAADQCPAASIYGRVSATTPLLDKPLTGNVYLRSSSHELPDLVTDLRGPAERPIRIEASGRTDSVKGGLRNTFDFMPDAPITRVVLKMKGAAKGLLQNGRNLCSREYRATVRFSAHNGRNLELRPKLLAGCNGSAKHRGKGRGASR